MSTPPDVKKPLEDGPSSPEDVGTPDFEHTEVSGSVAQLEERALGQLGQSFNRRSPFFLGFMGAIGVLTAYVLVRLVADLGTVMQLIGLSLFLAALI